MALATARRPNDKCKRFLKVAFDGVKKLDTIKYLVVFRCVVASLREHLVLKPYGLRFCITSREFRNKIYGSRNGAETQRNTTRNFIVLKFSTPSETYNDKPLVFRCVVASLREHLVLNLYDDPFLEKNIWLSQRRDGLTINARGFLKWLPDGVKKLDTIKYLVVFRCPAKMRGLRESILY